MTVIPEWQPTWNFTGDLGHVRILPGRLQASPLYSCAELDAKKARPQVQAVRPRQWSATPQFADVAISLVRDVILDHVGRAVAPTDESVELSARRSAAPRELSPATLLAVQSAVAGYRQVLADLRSSGQLARDAVLCRDLVVAQESASGGVVEWAAWGLHWIDRAGVRETHLLVWRAAGSRPRPDAALAVAVRVAAEGFSADPVGSWADRFLPAAFQPPPVTEVRVREVGLLDSSSAILFDGTAAEARARFDEHVPAALGRLSGGAFNPGNVCASCSIRPECRALPRVPGVLGVAARSPYLRRLSTSDLWKHESCPQQVHLMLDLGLPREPVPQLEASTRGRLVHEWLEAAHTRGIACCVDDLPAEEGSGPVATSLGWGADDARLVAAYLGHHVEQCPLAMHSASAVRPECPIAVHDTDVDVILTTRPDLVLRTADGAVVVRETKTLTRWREDGDELELLHGFPQVAAAVCLLAGGVDPLDPMRTLDPRGAVVELELLGPTAGTVIPYSIDDPEVVLAAQVALAERVDAWVLDDEHAPRPGRQCERCPVRSWCPASVVAQEQPLNEAAPDPIPLDVLALIEADVVADDDFPF